MEIGEESLYSAECFRILVGTIGLEPPTSRLSGVRSDLLSYKPLFFRRRPRPLFLTLGGDEENRTPDPLLARQVLSQLSYTPKKVRLGLTENKCPDKRSTVY